MKNRNIMWILQRDKKKPESIQGFVIIIFRLSSLA